MTKTLLFAVYIVFGISNSNTDLQNNCEQYLDTISNTVIYKKVTVKPYPKIGHQELMTAISNSIIYDEELIREIGSNDYKSKVTFIVGVDGKIKNGRVIKEIEYTTISAQVLDVIAEMEWIPAKCEETPVPYLFEFESQYHLIKD